jgi:hypothetical protein
MSRASSLALAALVFSIGDASADTPPDPSANAALKYWRGFATMPKLSDADAQKLITNYLTMPLDESAREIVSKSEYALKMMHYGAQLRNCDWGIDCDAEGVDALLPQMHAARTLATIAYLRARIRFNEGRQADAINDVIAALTMGRHVSLDGTLIGVLVGYSIEARASETLALHLPKLDARTIKELKSRLVNLAPGARPASALRNCEERTIDWLVRKLKGVKDKEDLLKLLSFVGITEGKVGGVDEKTRKFVEECGGTAEGVIKFAEAMRPSYAVIAQKMDLPFDQFEKEFEVEARKQAGNPVFKMLFPSIIKCRAQQERAEVRRALLMAAVAVQADGRDALKNYPDPASGNPFEHGAFDGGFELRSQMKQQDGKPVTLIVGRREK